MKKVKSQARQTANLWALIAACMVLLGSCMERTHYLSFQTIPEVGWAQNDTLIFSLPADLPEGEKTLSLEVRYTQYPYQNLAVSVGKYCDSVWTFLQPQTYTLVDEKGKHKGKGLGLQKQLSIPIGPLFFHGKSVTQLALLPAMGKTPLMGIQEMGIKLEDCAPHPSAAE